MQILFWSDIKHISYLVVLVIYFPCPFKLVLSILSHFLFIYCKHDLRRYAWLQEQNIMLFFSWYGFIGRSPHSNSYLSWHEIFAKIVEKLIRSIHCCIRDVTLDHYKTVKHQKIIFEAPLSGCLYFPVIKSEEFVTFMFEFTAQILTESVCINIGGINHLPLSSSCWSLLLASIIIKSYCK